MFFFVLGIMCMSLPIWIYALFEQKISLPFHIIPLADTFTILERSMVISYYGFGAGILLGAYSGTLLFRGIATEKEQKRSAKQIRESEEKYRMIFSTETDAIILFDSKDLSVIDINQAALDLYGYVRDETHRITLHDLTDIHGSLKGVCPDTTHFKGEKIHRTKSGDRIPVDVSAASFNANQKNYLCLIVRDINHRRELEERILNISNEERQRIGHDLHDGLGQELTAAALTAKVLENKLRRKSLPEADDLESLVSYLNKSISSTRAIARGLAPVSLEKNGLQAALKDLLVSLENQTGIYLFFYWPDNLEIYDRANEIHLYRIIQEAVNNSLKHSQSKEICVSFDMEENDDVTLSISDKGKGMSPESLTHPSLGMRTIQYRAAILGGQIEIISSKEAGTTLICHFNNTHPKEKL